MISEYKSVNKSVYSKDSSDSDSQSNQDKGSG